MKTRNLMLAVLAALVALTMVGSVATTANARDVAPSHRAAPTGVVKTKAGTVTAPVRFKSAAGSFKGVFRPTKFSVVGDQLMATGHVTGTVHKTGKKAHRVSQRAVVPVQSVNGTATGPASSNRSAAAAALTCNVLNLVLGPLDLNILGLQIHLDKVVLNITANPLGGLLGQLLCAIANLLNGGLAGIGGLLGLAALLNALLGALGL